MFSLRPKLADVNINIHIINVMIVIIVVTADDPRPASGTSGRAPGRRRGPPTASAYLGERFKHIQTYAATFNEVNDLQQFRKIQKMGASRDGWARRGSHQVIPVSVKQTLLLGEPLPCSPEAETAIQPLIWCSERKY